MNCDPLARWYRWLEYAAMGCALERRRFEFLPDMAQARRVLILGEGDGRFLQAFRHLNPGAEIDVVDNSARMLALAAHRAGSGRTRFHQTDARAWRPPVSAGYDLVVTHFFLDCFSDADLEPLISTCAAACSIRCQWVVSEFRQPARGMEAWRARLWIGSLYRLFGWTTGLHVRRLPDYAPILEKNGFRQTTAIVAEAGLLISERWERPVTLAFDAPSGAPLHSRTPKS